MSKIEIKQQFPYVVQAQYEHRTAADTHLQYHTTVNKKKTDHALNVDCLCHNLTTPTGHDDGHCFWRNIYPQTSKTSSTDR